jgi:hypothetical protein
MGGNSDIGRYDVPVHRSLFGLGIGMILASFHIWEMMFWLRARFRSSVRNWMAKDPRCFRWRMLMLSRPVELLFGELRMAS